MRSLAATIQARPSPQLWASLDPDVIAWRAAIFANGGTVGPAAVRAVNTMTRGLKADGVWPLILDMGILCGVDNLNAALVKLKTPAGVSRVLVNSNFVGADYTATGAGAGLRGNGASKYLSGLPPMNAFVSAGSFSIGYYGTLLNTGSGSRVPLAAGPTSGIVGFDHSATTTCYGGSTAATVSAAAVVSSGFVVGSAISATDLRLFANGTQTGTTQTALRASVTANAAYVFAYNSAGPAASHSAASIRHYFLGLGLSSSQVAALSARVNALMAEFGASVY